MARRCIGVRYGGRVKTLQRIMPGDSREMQRMDDGQIDMVVTSPPYPMIEMWDEVFSSMAPACAAALETGDGNGAFERMHVELDKVWREVDRVLKPGGFACINIGDATRTIAGRFRLYSNHSRIIGSFCELGFDCLPVILWRKQTNAPNKFMGSGMLPAGAYVTLEHEYILAFRKGGKREFATGQEKRARMESAFFWEERNRWFSDVWDFKGTVQELNHGELRSRSGAYPLELPYRLINMYSLYGDTVLDPFLGTGTTMVAAIATGRNSVGIEIDPAFSSFILEQSGSFHATANEVLARRIADHARFVEEQTAAKGPPKYLNVHHGFPVVTRQETGLQLHSVSGVVSLSDSVIEASYAPVGVLSDKGAVDRETGVIRNTGTGQLTLDL
jgi:modification methylase